jgi:hypothetical protein
MRAIKRFAIGALFAMLTRPRGAVAGTNAPCSQDIHTFCANLEPGNGAMQRCLQEHLGDLSSACRAHLQRRVEHALTPTRPDHTGAGRAKKSAE